MVPAKQAPMIVFLYDTRVHLVGLNYLMSTKVREGVDIRKRLTLEKDILGMSHEEESDGLLINAGCERLKE